VVRNEEKDRQSPKTPAPDPKDEKKVLGLTGIFKMGGVVPLPYEEVKTSG